MILPFLLSRHSLSKCCGNGWSGSTELNRSGKLGVGLIWFDGLTPQTVFVFHNVSKLWHVLESWKLRKNMRHIY